MTHEEPVRDLFNLAGRSLDGKYDVESVVAEGGFGVVYRGTHRTLKKPVAIKVLKSPPDLDARAKEAFHEGFAREAQVIARLDHPAIVHAIDFGASPMPTGETATWMVLEWLEGETLADALKARRGRGGRTPAEALTILRPVFEALACAHEQGVAHRDVKPANIMRMKGATTESTRHGKPATRLLDFGIAKAMEPDEQSGSGHTRTRSGLLSFSLPYAAPEQVSAARTGPWTDVHALGLVLTEVLTDQPPYAGGDPTEVCAQVLALVRPTPAHFGVDVGPWEPVLARALALAPRERFQDADAFLNALTASMPTESRRVVPVTVAEFAPTQALAGDANSTLRPASIPSSAPAAAPTHRGVALVALAGVTLVLALVLGVARLRSRDAPATPLRPSAPNAAPVVTPPVTVAPAVASTPPSATQEPTAPTAPAVDAGEADTETPSTNERRARRSRSRRPEPRTDPPPATPAVPATAPAHLDPTSY